MLAGWLATNLESKPASQLASVQVKKPSCWKVSNLVGIKKGSVLKGRSMIIALTNSKGGVGKSTLAVHLAVWIGEQGTKVALVDADVQGSSSAWLKEASPETPLFRLATADDILDQVPKIATQYECVVIDGPAGLSELTRTILFLADVTFLPCGPSVLDLRANFAARSAKVPSTGARGLAEDAGLETDADSGAGSGFAAGVAFSIFLLAFLVLSA